MGLDVSNLDGKLRKYRIYDEDDLDPIVNQSFRNWEAAMEYIIECFPYVTNIYLNGDTEVWNQEEGHVFLKGE